MSMPLETIFTRIANAIRSVDSSTELIGTDEMAGRILEFIYADKVKHSDPIYYGAAAIEVANVAESYVRAWSSDLVDFIYSEQTPLDGIIRKESRAAIDNATLIGLILRGYSFIDSPYNTEYTECGFPNVDTTVWKPENELPAWADSDLDNQDTLFFNNGIIRSASDLGLYMWMTGRKLSDPEDIKIGDLVFFSMNDNDGFKNISHVGIMYKSNSILVITAGEDNPTDVTFNFVNLESHSFDGIAFCARPDYTKYYILPSYNSETNRLIGPWVGLNKIDSAIAYYDTNNTTSITFTFDDIPEGNGVIFELYDEDISHIELEPGTYSLSGCPADTAGRLILQNIYDENDIIEDDGSGMCIFALNDIKHYKAYIQISKDLGFDGAEYTWTPTLIRTA